MFKTVVYVIAWIAGFLPAFRRRKPEPSKPLVRDATLDPDGPQGLHHLRGLREH